MANLLDYSLLNFETLLQSMPDLYLIIDPEFKIVAVSKAYADATKIDPKKVLGYNIFEVFPDNPNDLTATGVTNLRNSLKRVLKYKRPDTMAVQKYDIPSSREENNEFEVHYWSPVNTPVLDKNNEVKYIIHRVEDVTKFIKEKEKAQSNHSSLQQMEIEIYQRAQEIQSTNKRLYESEQRLRLFIEGCKDYAMLMLDSEGYIISWNAGAERIKGYKSEEIIGKHFSIFYPDQAIKDHYPEHELEMAMKYGRYEDEGWRVRKDGTKFWADVVITAMYDPNNHLIGFGKVTRDLTERKKSEEEILYLSNHDVLTKLYNRAAFTETLKKEIAKAHYNNTSLAVLMLDLDNFKTVNDTFGHHIGDQLLISVAKQLQESVRKSDFVARFGGDEFVIIFSDIVDEINVKKLAEKLIKRFSKPFKLENHYFHATLSIGIAVSPRAGQDEITLVKNADIALYSVKEYGRNNYQFFSDEISSLFKRRTQLESMLPAALEKNQFFIVYQPQYNLPGKKIIGMEALLRWNHPEMGLISPNEFIPIAEKSGLIVPIGEWVLKYACMQYVNWLSQGILSKSIKLAVNLSPKQLANDQFVTSFFSILNETGMPPQNLELELTETAVMTSAIDIDPILEELRKIGVSISIDDFGAGYSSLSRLKNLPVSSLKIDKSFIDSLGKNHDGAMIVKSIIALGNSLGLNVIPEGVETEEQLQLLIEYNCQMVQGFYFGKEPLIADDMTQLLQKSFRSD